MGTRSIYFKAKIAGQGVVNYDSKSSKYIVKKCFPDFKDVFVSSTGKMIDNIMIAKHDFKQKLDENGQPVFKTWEDGSQSPVLEAKVKISAECIRSHIFGEDIPLHNNDIIHAPIALVKFLASPANMLKGHLFTKKGDFSLKRKSAVNTCDAIQTNNAVPNFEIHNSRVPMKMKEAVDEKSGTSLYYKETVGYIEYILEGSIDVDCLQFISVSDRFNRMAVHPDHVEFFIETLSKNLGSQVSEVQWYKKKTSANELPEEGILLNQEQCLVLVKEFFKRLINLRIEKTKAFARVEEVKIMYLKDPLNDFPSDETKYHTIKSIDDITVKDFEMFYESMSEEDAMNLYSKIDGGNVEEKPKSAAKKTARKRAKK